MQLTFTPEFDYDTVCLRSLSFFTREHSGIWGLCGPQFQLSRHDDVCDGVRGILGRLSHSDGVR